MQSEEGYHWTHQGWSGDPAEPYRHWCKYPELKDTYLEIWNFIKPDLDVQELFPDRVIVNAYNYGDSSWLHKDSEKPDKWTAIVYLNDVWDLNWGGETILVEKEETLLSVHPLPGNVLLLDSRILHGPRPVSREAPLPRVAVAYQCTRR